jgi:hypothetical protein
MYTIIVLVAVITSVIARPVLRFAVRRTAGVSHEELVRELELAGDDVAAVAESGSLPARRQPVPRLGGWWASERALPGC